MTSSTDTKTYSNKLTYRLFDDTIEKQLQAGDELINFDGTGKVKVVEVKPAQFIDGIAYVQKDGKHGTIDKDGNELIPLIYDWVGFHFNQNKGLSLVKIDDRIGFVRSNGDIAIPIAYEDAEYYFCEDLIRVKLYGKWGYLDREGDVAIPVIYDEAGNFKNGKAEVRLDADRFYIDVNGRRLNS